MKYLKNAFELYINSSIHVSFAVVALSLVTYLEYDMDVDLNLLVFTFFASVTGYNFVKYAGIAKLHHLSLATNLRVIQIFSLMSFLALLFYVFKLNSTVLLAAGILGLFTLFYAVPLSRNGKNLRSLPGLKIFIIALVWAGSTVLLPLINGHKYLGLEVIVDFIQRLLLVVILTLPFEIRDLEFDKEALGTIPQKIGVFRTKVFGTFLLVLIFFIELLQKSFESDGFLALSILLLGLGFFLWGAKKRQSKYYSAFWVEALPMLYLGVYLLFKSFLPQIPF